MAKLSDMRSCLSCIYFLGSRGCSHNAPEYRQIFAEYGITCASMCTGYAAGGDTKAFISNDAALPFMLAGKSEFTVVSMRTAVRFSFKLTKKKSTSGAAGAAEFIYFVNVIHGDNSIYGGLLYFDNRTEAFMFSKGKTGLVGAEDVRIKSLLYIVNNLLAKNYGIDVSIYHCGKCGRCGKKLTTPESVLTGLGPECCKLSGIPRVKMGRT